MSTHPVASPSSIVEGYPGLLADVTASLRAPASVAWTDPTVTYRFTPDLSAQEATTLCPRSRSSRQTVGATAAVGSAN